MSDVFITKINKTEYPQAPFHPNSVFPEFANTDIINSIDHDNEIYSAVRDIFYNLGFDKENFGKSLWNPLKSFVIKGDKILLKPNFVKGNHPLGNEGVLSMITHASIMRPVIDYLLLATGDDCEIIIGDVPLQSSVWEEIITISCAKELVKYYDRENIKLLDMRREMAIFNEENVIVDKIITENRNEADYVVVDLGKDSALSEISEFSNRLEITDYGFGTVPKHHNQNKNEYLIAGEILDADCIINLPKMKTHRKAGITCAMKNLVGINGDKSWIAHHRRGLPKNGGDEFENFHLQTVLRERFWNFIKTKKMGVKFATFLKKGYKTFIWRGKSFEEISMEDNSPHYREGSWQGNDTIWRCIRDLNQILFYADKKGDMKSEKQRKYLCIVDGILSGEKEGPMEHLPKQTGLILGGTNPVEIDFAVAEIMGFDYHLIPSIDKAFSTEKYELIKKKPDEIEIESNCDNCHYQFQTPKGWKNIYNTFKGNS